jgi:hypothetical protein
LDIAMMQIRSADIISKRHAKYLKMFVNYLLAQACAKKKIAVAERQP